MEVGVYAGPCSHLPLSAVLRSRTAVPAAAGRLAAAAVDQYLLPARRSAANPPQRRAAGE